MLSMYEALGSIPSTSILDFPGGPLAVSALPMQGAWGLIPDQGTRSRMLQLRPRAAKQNFRASLIAQLVKNQPAMQETWV